MSEPPAASHGTASSGFLFGARIVLIPPGALASVPMSVRLAAIGAGFLAFLLIRRSALAGVLAGEAVLIAGALAFGA